MSTPALPEYLTVSQAAAALGIGERQARRYAGRLSPDDRREARHEAGHVTGALVSLAAMRIEREKATRRAAADVRPGALEAEAGHVSGHDDRTPDAQNGEVLALLKSENTFLRGLVEQRDRDAAELRAALRKALEAMPKAITSGEVEQRPGGGDCSSVPATQSAPITETTPPAKQSPQKGRKREISPVQRIVMRLIGVRIISARE